MQDRQRQRHCSAGGALKPGRFLNYTDARVKTPTPLMYGSRFTGEMHGNLLLSILHIFGGTDTVFGMPQFCTGGLKGFPS